MGSFIVDMSMAQDRKPFTVIYTHDMPLDGGIAQIIYTIRFAVDRFEAAEKSIAGLGGYGTIIAVLEGHHIPVLQGPGTYIWDSREEHDDKEIKVTQVQIKQTNPAKLIPRKKGKNKT